MNKTSLQTRSLCEQVCGNDNAAPFEQAVQCSLTCPNGNKNNGSLNIDEAALGTRLRQFLRGAILKKPFSVSKRAQMVINTMVP